MSEQPNFKDGFLTTPDGLNLHYRALESAGPGPSAYPPFLLIHGLASGSTIWDKVAQTLVRLTGSRTVVFDQRGHGLSDKPDDGYTTEQIVAEDHFLAGHLGLEKPVLVGHSWGATIALAYAATYPEGVSGVALIDGGLFNIKDRPGGDNWNEVARRLAPPEFGGTPLTKLLEFYRAGAQGRFLAPVWDAQLEEMITKLFDVREDKTVWPWLSRENHLKVLRSFWETDNKTLAPAITCPVLMVSAEPVPDPDKLPDDDTEAISWIRNKRVGAENLKTLLVNAPRSEFVIMSDTIHDIPLQRPAELAGLLINFFASQP